MTATTSMWMHHQLACARPILAAEGPSMLRIVVASVVAWQVCVWLGAQQPPIFAVIVPLVALRDAPYSALNVSMVRLTRRPLRRIAEALEQLSATQSGSSSCSAS